MPEDLHLHHQEILISSSFAGLLAALLWLAN